MAAHRQVPAFTSAPVAPEQLGAQALRAVVAAEAVPPKGHASQPEPSKLVAVPKWLAAQSVVLPSDVGALTVVTSAPILPAAIVAASNFVWSIAAHSAPTPAAATVLAVAVLR